MDTNSECRVCGAPAYAGLLGVECSRGAACGVVATTPQPVLMSGPLKGFANELGVHANGDGLHVEHPLPEGALREWRRAWDERAAARREARDQHAPDPVTETTPEPTSWVPKVGEWVRLVSGSRAGTVFRVDAVDADSAYGATATGDRVDEGWFHNHKQHGTCGPVMEPWGPRVGERVRLSLFGPDAEVVTVERSEMMHGTHAVWFRRAGDAYSVWLPLHNVEPAQ